MQQSLLVTGGFNVIGKGEKILTVRCREMGVRKDCVERMEARRR